MNPREIKHDGFRIIARRDGEKIRLTSRNGKDLTYRFPFAVQAVASLPVNSCIIDGEAMVSYATGLAVFSLIRGYRNGHRMASEASETLMICDGCTLAVDRAPKGKFKVRSGTAVIDTTILADQVLELRTRQGQVHVLRRRKVSRPQGIRCRRGGFRCFGQPQGLFASPFLSPL